MARYDPLRRYLDTHRGERVTLGFEEIAELVGGLPPSAFEHQAWWANTRSHPNAAAWLDAGWTVTSHDLRRRRVTFRKTTTQPTWGAVDTGPGTTAPPHRTRSSGGKAEARRRVAALIKDFQPLLDYYDAALPFDRSGATIDLVCVSSAAAVNCRRAMAQHMVETVEDQFEPVLEFVAGSWCLPD